MASGRLKSKLFIFLVSVTGTLLGGCEKSRLDEEVTKLCAMDGGIKVYETVKLPHEKFNQFGNVEIPSKDKAKQEDLFFYELDTKYLKTGNPEMWRSHHRIIRREDGKLLGESIRYTRRGGDMPGPWHETAYSCPGTAVRPSLEEAIFSKQ
jgi:hypothetical protein